MTKQSKATPTAQVHRGLVNPEVTPRKSSQTTALRNAPHRNFETHIPEPSWQQIVSVIVVIGLLILEILSWLHGRK